MAVMDWFSRYVLSWALSLTLEVDFCIEALRGALRETPSRLGGASRYTAMSLPSLSGFYAIYEP